MAIEEARRIGGPRALLQVRIGGHGPGGAQAAACEPRMPATMDSSLDWILCFFE